MAAERFEITRKQIEALDQHSHSFMRESLRAWFPTVFKQSVTTDVKPRYSFTESRITDAQIRELVRHPERAIVLLTEWFPATFTPGPPKVKKWRWVYRNSVGELGVTHDHMSAVEAAAFDNAHCCDAQIIQRIDSTEKEF